MTSSTCPASAPEARCGRLAARMNLLEFCAAVGAGSFVAGLLGALTGLGGGLVIVPMLTLAFDVAIRYAIGA